MIIFCLIKFGFDYRGNLSIFGLTRERATLSESMHSLGFSLSRITVGVTAALEDRVGARVERSGYCQYSAREKKALTMKKKRMMFIANTT